MAGMINCMRFRPKEGQAEALFKAFAEYTRDFPFDDIMHHIINLGDGEYALVGVHHSVKIYGNRKPRKQGQRNDERICGILRRW